MGQVEGMATGSGRVRVPVHGGGRDACDLPSRTVSGRARDVVRQGWDIVPAAARHGYTDVYGNDCQRVVLPVGESTLRYDERGVDGFRSSGTASLED